MNRTTLCVLVLALSGLAASSEEPPRFKLDEILQPGPIELEVMTIGLSDRAIELTQKLQESVANHKDWFLEYTKNATPGEPLKYDTRLGLSKEEYEEYLIEVKKRTVESTGRILKADFIVTDQILSIGLDDESTPLSKIRVNLNTTDLAASVGHIGKGVWESSDRTDIPIGPWEGYTWMHESGSLEALDIRLVSLEILRRKENGNILWIFKDAELEKGKIVHHFELMFEHAPRKASNNRMESNG